MPDNMGSITLKINKLFLATDLQHHVDHYALALEAAKTLESARSPPPGINSRALIHKYISAHPLPITPSNSPVVSPVPEINAALNALEQIQTTVHSSILPSIQKSLSHLSSPKNGKGRKSFEEIERQGEDVLKEVHEAVKCIRYRLVVQSKRSEEASTPIWAPRITEFEDDAFTLDGETSESVGGEDGKEICKSM